MSPLLGILAGPTAAAAVDAAKVAVSAISRPFADVLGALAGQTEPAAAIPDHEDNNEDLNDRVAARLQEILEAAGAAPGDCSSIRYDETTSEVEVNHGALSGVGAQREIESDKQLMDDLRQMAENDESSNDCLDLLIRVG